MGLFDIFRKKEEKQPEDVVAPVQETPATDSNGTPSDSEATTNDEPAVKITNGIKIPISKPVTQANNEVSEEPGGQVKPTTVEELAPETPVEEVGPTTVEELAPETLVEEVSTATVEAPAPETPVEEVNPATVEAPAPETPVEEINPATVEAPTPETPVEEINPATDEELAPETPVEEVSTATDEELAPETEEAAYDKGLEKSRKSFGERLNAFFAKFRSVDEDFFEDLEDTLIQADVGYQTAMQISDELRDEVKLKNAKNKEAIRQVIVDKLIEIYEASGNGEDNSMHFAPEGPTVILFVGVNGVGKTTTIGKMANLYKSEGKKVLLAAADTFRAGATQQLQEWGRRDGVDVVAGPDRIDPASVVFDAVKKAKAENYDVLFVDTAGRLQNNVNLMQELAKMKRIISRELPTAPHEVLIVLDGTTGQNALQQAKLFKESTDVTGIVLTKLDGTAKGGIILAIRNEMHLPVKWVGLGEQATDLRKFSPDQFVQGLFKGLID